MAKIFISYSRKDSKAAQKLIGALEDMGHEVWVDWEAILPASDWLQQIYRGIEGVDAFIFLISPHSIISEVCNLEVGHAALNNKRIVPVVIRTVKPEDTNEDIRKRNWVFLRRNDKYKEGLAKVNDAIELDFEWVEEHSRLQSRALVWDRKKDASLLLRGSDLRRARRSIANAKDKEPLPTDLQNIYVKHSTQDERRRTVLWIVSAVTVIVLAGLAFFAFDQRDLANQQRILAERNEARAVEQELIARENEQEANQQREIAEEQQKIAEQQREIAEEQELIAQAQRSAARAQIYQIQPDELYTSTLLAIASWKDSPSDEANEILRKNISLLPIPINQLQRNGSINSLEFNAEGDLFVTGGADGKACVWDASDGEMIFCWTSPKAVNDAVFSPDGKFMVTGDVSGEVKVIRTSDWGEQSTYNAGTIVWDIDISIERKEIAVTRDDGRIAIVDLESGEEKYPLFVTGNIKIASFSPDGDYLAAGSDAGVVNLWNLDAGGDPITSGRHSGEVFTLAFSPDSEHLITGGEDGYAVVAHTFNGQEAYKLLHEDAVRNIAISPDATWFATVSSDRRIRIWDITDGDERLRMSQNNVVQEVKISANGQWLATTGEDKTVRVWNASTGAEIFQIPLRSEGWVLDFSSDGNTLAAGDEGGEINIWDISSMPVSDNSILFDDLIRDIKISPSNDWAAASDGARVWLLKPEQLPTLTANELGEPEIITTGNVVNLAFSPDSDWLGIATDEGYLLVYDFVNRALKTLTASGTMDKIAFSPNSSLLLVSQPGGSVDAWNMETKESTVAFAGGAQDVASFAVGPSQIALGVRNRVAVINESGLVIPDIETPGIQSTLVFSADGSILAASNSAGFIEIWKSDQGSYYSVGSLQKEEVLSMAFNPLGTQLAIGTTSAAYLINPDTAQEEARIPHAGNVNAVAYSLDEKFLITASQRSLQFWDISKIQTLQVNELVDAACERMVSNFSEAQWSNLFGGQEYEVLCENLPVP